MYSNGAIFQSTIILLPSPVDDKLVFGLGYIWTTFVVRVKHRVHTNSAGERSSFLSGPQKMAKKMNVANEPSISPRHICTAVVKDIMGCRRQLVFWHSCQTCFKANIKVFSIATWSTVTSLIKMLCLLWREECIYQLKSLRAGKIRRCQAAFCNGLIFVRSRHLNELSQNKLSKANSFLLTSL